MSLGWLEANQTIIRNDIEIDITITAIIDNGKLREIIAFDNDGNHIHLTPIEQEAAEFILLSPNPSWKFKETP